MSEKDKELGWIQCTQCGWGCEVRVREVEAGDYHDRQACPECCLGPCLIDWAWSDGPGPEDNKATTKEKRDMTNKTKQSSTVALTQEQVRALLKEGAECRKDVEARLNRMHQRPDEIEAQSLRTSNRKMQDRVAKLESDLEYALDRIARLEKLLFGSEEE